MAIASRPLKQLFLDALAVPQAERAAWLSRECPDAPLRQQIELMLAAHDAPQSLLDRVAPPPASPGPVTEEYVAESIPAGTTIGPYKLLQQIGEGGMGVVYMAEQSAPVERRVALKIIKPGMDTRQVIARFEAERQVLAMMDHPNIAKVFDAGTTDSGRPYFVMELVRGIPITKYCDEHQLTLKQRLELFLPVCHAVQHAHQKGIIHRDLKPTNVLVAHYDDKPVPKVIDFGVAKAAQKLTERTMFTEFGQVVGTLEYMSPEQARLNQLDVDTRSDIYSLGVLLYELLTGCTPFDGKRLRSAAFDEMLRIIREEEPPKPSTRLSSADTLPSIAASRSVEPARLGRSLRGELDWIVMKALEKDRNRRYETANGFAADIQRYLADEPVQACPPSAGYRLKKFSRRNKGALAVAALMLVFLVLLGSVAGWTMRDRAAREAEAARQQSHRQAKAGGQVEPIFAEVDRLEGEQKWPEALAAARRAEAVVAGGEADATTAERVRGRLKDLEFIDQLEQIRMRGAMNVNAGNYDDPVQADMEYARAFREYEVDLESLSIEQSIERLKFRPALSIPLAATLQDWANVRVNITNDKYSNALSKRLIAIARGIDPAPLRDWLRSNWGKSVSADELRRVVGALDLHAHHPTTLRTFASRLGLAKDEDAAIKLLRDVQTIYPQDFWTNFELARRLAAQKDHQGAVRFYTAAVSIRPNAIMALGNLGIELKGEGKHDEAIAVYRRVLDIDPKSAITYSNLGFALKDQGKLDEAIACCRKAIELDPKSAGAYSHLGLALMDQKKLNEAVEACRKAIELEPKNAKGYCNLGVALSEQKKLDEAVAAYRKAIEIDPKFAIAYRNLGMTLAHQNKLDEAIAACRKAIELEPKNAKFHYVLAIVLSSQERVEEAVAACEKAILLDSQLGPAHGQLAFLLATCVDPKFRNPDRAVALAKKAIELTPATDVNGQTNVSQTLGWALYRAGDWKGSIAALEKSMALQRSPKGGDSGQWFPLAMAHWKLGEKEKAREFYNRAVKWMDEHQPKNEELLRFRAEAAELLGVEEKQD